MAITCPPSSPDGQDPLAWLLLVEAYAEQLQVDADTYNSRVSLINTLFYVSLGITVLFAIARGGMYADRSKWPMIVGLSFVTGGFKLCLGLAMLVLIFTLPSDPGCIINGTTIPPFPTVGASSYLWCGVVILLGVSWIARGIALKNSLAGSGPVLSGPGTAVVTAYAVAPK